MKVFVLGVVLQPVILIYPGFYMSIILFFTSVMGRPTVPTSCHRKFGFSSITRQLFIIIRSWPDLPTCFSNEGSSKSLSCILIDIVTHFHTLTGSICSLHSRPHTGHGSSELLLLTLNQLCYLCP